jgi:Macrocin-O-methyltransferase (TylF)
MSAGLPNEASQRFYSYRSSERKKSRLQRFLARECANWLMATVGAFLNRRNAKLYLAFRPDSHFDFDRFPQFAEFFQFFSRGKGKANGGDLPRLYSLLLNVARVIRENIPGDMAELGVYEGNTARILAEAARSSGRRLYLFDTFAGFHPGDLRGPDQAGVPGHFGDTSLENVKAFVGTHGVEYIVGRFPDSLAQQRLPQQFSIVHLDCDLRDPMLAGLNFFYPRLPPGGLLILHDYSSGHWTGACQAIDAFIADKPERLVLMPDKSGSAILIKCAS